MQANKKSFEVARLFSPESIQNLALITLINSLGLFILAQIHFYLPFTEIPITGQTFGVLLIAMLFPPKVAISSIGLYLIAGFSGLPVFASFKSGFGLISLGYLVGMFFSGLVISFVAQKVQPIGFLKAISLSLLGHLVIFAFGMSYLYWIIQVDSVWSLGLLPFIPGLLIKSSLLGLLFHLKNKNK